MKKIFVVTHKSYDFPCDDNYQPIKVGSADVSTIAINDSTGDSISKLNSSFCELTALYWIWKNNTDRIIGLMHYRRYFKHSDMYLDLRGKKIASSDDFRLNEKGIDLVIHKPRNYYITSIKNHYCKAHYGSDYVMLREEIIKQYPDYLVAFDKVMDGSELSLYNMFVAKREIIEPYFKWLFDILLALEEKIDYQQYDSYQKRIFGFMAERLFNVWIEHNRNHLNIEYRAVVNIEGENILKKGFGLLKRHTIRK